MPSRSATALLAAACVAGSLGACTRDSGPAPASVASTPQTPTTSGSTTAAPTALPSGYVLGPDAVAIMSITRDGDGRTVIDVIGPEGADYRVREANGAVTECTQTVGEVATTAPPGLPVNATHHATLTCGLSQPVQSLTADGAVLVRVNAGATFSYDFEVPATPYATP